MSKPKLVMKLGRLWCANVVHYEGLIDLALDTRGTNSPPQIIATAEGTGTDADAFSSATMVEH
jgi:hypothetical protein